MNHISYEGLIEFIRQTNEKSKQLQKERSVYAAENPILPEETVLDEDKSVRWNREEVVRLNNSRKGKLASYMTKINHCDKEISEKIVEYLKYECKLPDAVAQIVFNEAYEDGHSAGYEKVALYANGYASFAERILDAVDA